MPELYKQNRKQWMAIIVIAFFLVCESQFRATSQSAMEDNMKRRAHSLDEDIQSLQHTQDIMNSSMHVTVHPKHKNHQH